MNSSPARLLGLLAAALGFAAQAAGPYSYDGRGGAADWARWRYGPVRDGEIQQITFQLQTAEAGANPQMHWAFGLRGAAAQMPCPVSDEPQFAQGCPLGRGIVFGHFPDGFGSGGVCHGVAVENFTVGYDGEKAIVAGTCVPFRVLPNRRYAFIVRVSTDNVGWILLDLNWVRERDPQTGEETLVPRWTPLASGGCLETAGRSCPEIAEVDADYADVFVASGFLSPGESWKVEDLRIIHY